MSTIIMVQMGVVSLSLLMLMLTITMVQVIVDVDVDNNIGSSDNNVFHVKSHGVCWVSRERRVDRMKRLFGVERKD